MQIELSNRLLEFAVQIVRMAQELNKNFAARHIFGQLLRSSTSSGANYEEACAGQSRADFVHKLQIVLKELRESLYWLRLLKKSNLLKDKAVNPLIKEADELSRIVGKSIVTAKRNR